MKTKPPFVLVHNNLSHDTVDVLQTLLNGAEEGRIIGVAFCVMYKQREFAVDTTGEAYRNPTFTRGMLACLDDKLRC